MGYAKSILSGTNNYIGKGSDRIALINCHDCSVEQNMTGLTAINCSGFNFTGEHNNRVYIENRLVVPNKSITIAADTITSSVNITGLYSTYFLDLSNGSAFTAYFDVEALLDCEITIKIVDFATGGSLTIDGLNGIGEIDGETLPWDTTAVIYESVTITSDGTKLWIL